MIIGDIATSSKFTGCINNEPVQLVIFYNEVLCEIDRKYYDASMNEITDKDLIDLFTTDCSEFRQDPELSCFSNDGGETVIHGFVEFDTSSSPADTVFYTIDGTKLTTDYVKIDCDIDYEPEEYLVHNAAGQRRKIIYRNEKNPEDIVGPIYINPQGNLDNDPGNLAIYDVVLEDTLTTCECKPGEECAVQRTVGCRDDRRDDALKAIKKHTDKKLRPSDTLRGKSFIGTDEQLLNLPKASSVTVTLTGGVGNVEVTFDGGATRDYVLRGRGSRTWGKNGGYTINTNRLGFRGTDATTEYDVIAEIPA